MKTYLRAFAILAVSMVNLAIADDPDAVRALRAKFPDGIPWNVDVIGTDGKSRGTLVMRITSEHASSCLEDLSNGVRVDFPHKPEHPPLAVNAYGIAKFDGDKIKIDLTGGMCDAYLLMSGTVQADGSSTGEVYTFGMRGGHDIGTYRATIR